MYIYGAGGHAKDLIDNLQSLGEEIEGIFDDFGTSEMLYDYPVRKYSPPPYPSKLLIGIGDNHTRRDVVLKVGDVSFGTIVSSSAVVSRYVTFGEGTAIQMGALIQNGGVIGRHTIVNIGAIIGHDCTLGDFVHLAPNATLLGNVSIGDLTLIGAGSVVVPGVKVGSRVVVYAGSTVTHDVPDGVAVAGSPAKIIKVLESV